MKIPYRLFFLAFLGAGAWLAAQEIPDEDTFRRAAQLRGLADAEMENANYGRALDYLEELAALLPDNILPPINRAICLFRLNRSSEALQEILKARALDPENPQLLYTLARILQDDPNQRPEWEGVITQFQQARPRDARPHFLRAEQAERDGDWSTAAQAYQEAVRRDPENLVLLTALLVAAAETRDLDATSEALDAVEDRLNGFEGSPAEFAETLRQTVAREEREAMRPPALVLRNLLRPTDLYQLGLVPLTGGQVSGGQLFPQLDFDPPLPKNIQGGQDIEFRYEEITESLGQEIRETSALILAPRQDSEDLFWLDSAGVHALSVVDASSAGRELLLDPQPTGHLLYQDLDQDGVSDLASADVGSGVWLYRGVEAERFATGVLIHDLAGPDPVSGLYPLDIDHDGDLDLFVTRRGAADLYLQNNGDATWSDQTEALGLAGTADTTSGLACADFDDDGDLDLLTVHLDSPPRLFLNRRAGPLVEAAGSWGLGSAPFPTAGVQTADFDNDGQFDLLLWGSTGGQLLFNRGNRFEPLALPGRTEQAWKQVTVTDFDNDGDQDALIVFAAGEEILLLRNRRSDFELQSIGLEAEEAETLVPGDFDRDGDQDLAARLADGSLRLWRNEGGNRNQWVGLRLMGRSDNNSKNNTEGLFARIEVRIGDSYQALMGNGGINHLGLGAARQADVIRVVWTNGLAQTWLQVSANRTMVEEQVLKGSCPFLYAWNGEEFEFVTDLMWRSPLGMIFSDGTPAPHQSARDYVLIAGEQLIPSGGELWIQITEELWETVYVDRLELMAVDHPEDSELVVDEAYRPPPHPVEPPAHWVEKKLRPTAAIDQGGRSVLPQLESKDGRYVADLPLSRYQGLTRGHHLELTFTDVPAGERLRLLLWGWIFPTDTSINFALAQDSSRSPQPPSLEVLESAGNWRTLEPFMGFPNGKRKAVVVDLTNRVPAGTLTLRIPTNLQIYWDAAALAVGEPRSEARWTPLEPVTADIHYRGYSQMYRASDSGPHLFEYRHVDVTPRFRDLAGDYTRFGPVDLLLGASDDLYVVMNAGDEMTVRFDARSLPPLPRGWRRDWVLFTDGWVKDGDIHTSHSQSVRPLPYHGMTSYPSWPVHQYPETLRHRQYLEQYQNRPVTDAPFRTWLRPKTPQLDGPGPNG